MPRSYLSRAEFVRDYRGSRSRGNRIYIHTNIIGRRAITIRWLCLTILTDTTNNGIVISLVDYSTDVVGRFRRQTVSKSNDCPKIFYRRACVSSLSGWISIEKENERTKIAPKLKHIYGGTTRGRRGIRRARDNRTRNTSMYYERNFVQAGYVHARNRY